MSVDDFPSEGERRLPPRVYLYEAVTARYAADVQAVKDAVVKRFGGVDREDVRQFVEGGEHGDILTVHYAATKQSFHLDGSDEVQIDHINAPRRAASSDGFVMMNVSLFADGSPFMRDQDLDHIGSNMGETYTVFLTPERDPFIVSLQELEGYMGPNRLDYSPYAYLEQLREKEQMPRDLSDAEAHELLAAIAGLEIDYDTTISDSL